METAYAQKPNPLMPRPCVESHRSSSNTRSLIGIMSLPRQIQGSLNSVGTILLVLTITVGLIFTASSKNRGDQALGERPFTGASTGIGVPADDPGERDAPGGGYQETQFSGIVLPYTYFDRELLDGRFATLDRWEIEPVLTTSVDTSTYRSSGIAVAFMLQGALVATFESQVAIARHVAPDTYSGAWLIGAGQPVELVTGDVIAYEIGQTISIQNPFPTLPTEILQVVISDDGLPAALPELAPGVAVNRHAEEQMPILLSTLGAGMAFQLSTYWNLSGGEVHVDATRNLLFAPAPTGNSTPATHGFVISIGEAAG